MYSVLTAHRVRVISFVALAWLVTGCGSSGSSGSDTSPADEISFSLSLTSLDVSTTPGGPAVNVNGLPVVSKRLVLKQDLSQ
jgi:hypothetical protein